MMFDRPDAEYIQDLLAGYVLGKLSQAEMLYLQGQVAQDPQLGQALRQLEQALDSLPQNRQPELNPQTVFSAADLAISVPPLPRSALPPFPMRPPMMIEYGHRRTARWITLGSILIAMGLVALSLPWLRSQYDIPHLSVDIVPAPTESVWQGLAALLADHGASQPIAPAPSGTAIANQPPEAADIKTALGNFVGETDTLVGLNHASVTLLGGSYYEQAGLQGIRLNYQLDKKIGVSLYQFQQSEALKLPPILGQVYLESNNGVNLLLWSSDQKVYGLVATLPLAKLQALAKMVKAE